jgi:protein-L-isoaspartate(D-aspartate) O-methyltransferase
MLQNLNRRIYPSVFRKKKAPAGKSAGSEYVTKFEPTDLPVGVSKKKPVGVSKKIHILKQTSIIVLLFFFLTLAGMSQTYNTAWFDQKRSEMVRDQIRVRGIKDEKVIAAMLRVERHRFVPWEYRAEAYQDYPLPIGDGQTISQPYIVAFMTEALKLDPHDKVLEIGTGSGYQAAILAEICDSVYTVEIFQSLARSASKVLGELGYQNVFIKVGDGFEGWEEHAPYDGIIVTCAPENIPEKLQEQLAEGGRMIIPVGGAYTQELILIEKKNGKLQKKTVLPVRFVPMINEKGIKY